MYWIKKFTINRRSKGERERETVLGKAVPGWNFQHTEFADFITAEGAEYSRQFDD